MARLNSFINHFNFTVFLESNDTYVDILNNALEVMKMFFLFRANLLKIADYIVKSLVKIVKGRTHAFNLKRTGKL